MRQSRCTGRGRPKRVAGPRARRICAGAIFKREPPSRLLPSGHASPDPRRLFDLRRRYRSARVSLLEDTRGPRDRSSLQGNGGRHGISPHSASPPLPLTRRCAAARIPPSARVLCAPAYTSQRPVGRSRLRGQYSVHACHRSRRRQIVRTALPQNSAERSFESEHRDGHCRSGPTIFDCAQCGRRLASPSHRQTCLRATP